MALQGLCSYSGASLERDIKRRNVFVHYDDLTYLFPHVVM